MRFRVVMLALACLFIAVPAWAVDRVVDDNGVACLSGRPLYTTISSAVAAAVPGETILVCPGTYTEQVTVDKANLTVRAQGLARLIGSSSGDGFTVTADGVTIQGFDISGFICGVQVSSVANQADIRDNRVHHNGNGICITGRTHRVRYNVVEANQSNGIFVSFATGDVTNNTVKDNGGYGISAESCWGPVTIDHNQTVSNDAGGISVNRCPDAIITNNTVDMVTGRGIGISVYQAGGQGDGQASSALVKLNLVQHAGAGIVVVGGAATVTFNSVSFNGTGIDILQSNGTTVLRNNVSRSSVVDCYWDGFGSTVLTKNSCGTQDPAGAFD